MMREWPYTALSWECIADWMDVYWVDDQEMSRGPSPRDISWALGNLEVRGDVQPNESQLETVYSHSLIINSSLGIYQETHPWRMVD